MRDARTRTWKTRTSGWEGSVWSGHAAKRVVTKGLRLTGRKNHVAPYIRARALHCNNGKRGDCAPAPISPSRGRRGAPANRADIFLGHGIGVPHCREFGPPDAHRHTEEERAVRPRQRTGLFVHVAKLVGKSLGSSLYPDRTACATRYCQHRSHSTTCFCAKAQTAFDSRQQVTGITACV